MLLSLVSLSLILLRLGNPAHRGHPGEGLHRRGGAAEGGHRHIRARPVWCRWLGHGLKQRRARRLLAAMSSRRGAAHALHAHTLKHTKRSKQTRPTEGEIPTQFACSVDINRAGRKIEALFFVVLCFFFYCSVHTLTCTVVGSLARFAVRHLNMKPVLHLTFGLFLCSLACRYFQTHLYSYIFRKGY